VFANLIRKKGDEVMIVGCKCGKSRIVSQKPDYEYGQYYCVIKCEECEYYWEGYMGHCYKEASASEDMASCEIREERLLDDNRGTEGA
jgi:hypothetical protein